MKASTAMKMVGGALIVLASLNASAQSSDAAAAPAAAASSATTGKQAKAANRALGRKVPQRARQDQGRQRREHQRPCTRRRCDAGRHGAGPVASRPRHASGARRGRRDVGQERTRRFGRSGSKA